MKKMPCLFERAFHGRGSFTILETVTPGCEWVLAGEGIATRKWDGTACAVINGALYKRYDAKRNPKTGEYKLPPIGAIPCDVPDPVTGHWPHWVKVDGDNPQDKHHWAAWRLLPFPLVEGTYELVGPAFNANPQGFVTHEFRRHGDETQNVIRTFEAIRNFLILWQWEGIVFHNRDGGMCKIRRADFGLQWPIS